MRAKYFIGVVGILLMFVVNAAEPYQLHGTITDHIINSDIVLIGYDQYQIDRDTIVHAATRRGELGAIFISGQNIGFNVVQHPGELPYITEVWVLDGNE